MIGPLGPAFGTKHSRNMGTTELAVFLPFASHPGRTGVGRFLSSKDVRDLRSWLITSSLSYSPCVLPMRRSGIFLRHSHTVTNLLSLNGTLGMVSFCRLLPNFLLFSIAPSLDNFHALLWISLQSVKHKPHGGVRSAFLLLRRVKPPANLQ